jgi:hypothetical protein
VISADRDAELNRLKALFEKLVDKVNAPGHTPEARLGAVEDRVDEMALHGVRMGTTLGLAAMATLTSVNYSTRPRGFYGGAPDDTDDIEATIERLDGHDVAIADSIHPVYSEQAVRLVCIRDVGILAIKKKFYLLYLSCDDFFNLCI